MTPSPVALSPNDSRRNDPRYNLEIGSDTPAIHLMVAELEKARTAASYYYRRNSNAYNMWFARWAGQTLDGRKHGPDAFPWPNSSDTRIRAVENKVNEHLAVAEWAIDSAKIQARKLRPLNNPRQGAQVNQFLDWLIYTHMQAEIQREIPLALAWRFGYGASLLKIEWEVQRRVNYFDVNLPTIDQILMARQGQDPNDPAGGGGFMLQLMQAVMDPAQAPALMTLIQELSPVVTRSAARKIVRDLRETHYARIPVADVYASKPKITAKRPCVEVLFPADMDDPQSTSTRWISDREWVSQTELEDRMETEGYSEEFVREALKHRGKAWDGVWVNQTMMERGVFGTGITPLPGGDYYGGYLTGPASVEETQATEMVELHHFYFRALMNGAPAIYKTVFNPSAVGRDRDNPIYATHDLFEYEHGRLPFIAMRNEQYHRPLLTSRGIPEIAYTWEQEMKVQADGMTDRTSLIHSPPMIVPQNKVALIKGHRLPGAVLGMNRPNDISWQPLPESDNTPIEVQRMVKERMDDHFPLFGVDVDPDKKRMFRIRLTKKVLGEWNLALGQVLLLAQQYEPDETVSKVTGPLARPFHLEAEELRGQYELSCVADATMLSEDEAMKKLDMLGKAMVFNQAGTANMSALFKLAMEIIDPDAADLGIIQDDQQATKKEMDDELAQTTRILNGIEPDMPMFGNHQLRLNTLLGATLNSPNPRMIQRLTTNPDSLQLLQNRIKFLQNQIQQQTQNPQIGRMLATKTFQPNQAPEAALPVA